MHTFSMKNTVTVTLGDSVCPRNSSWYTLHSDRMWELDRLQKFMYEFMYVWTNIGTYNY